MEKNAIKKYAVWARRELIERVSQRAMIYGITAKDAGNPNAESVNGHLLSQAEKRQRQALIRNIKTKGYEQVMEEVAYTWFNRFAALRFMEVNGYLPSHIRVFTNDAGEFKPQILAEAIHLELDGLDMNKVYELESANKSEELFKYLLIVQCNALNSILPGMFQRIEDYTELLLPDYLLREGSVIEQMITTIPEEDWTDQVQIIGWLYEGYNTERNEIVYDGNMAKTRITKDLLSAATTIFTPDWPIRYMVENTLGRLWLEGHPNDDLKAGWRYYLDNAEQEPGAQVQFTEIQKEYATLKPEDILAIDPCQGSGHILAYMFDVLIQIYESYGYSARDAASSIVEHNIWGLDIDERASQLAYFSIMMKARQYDRRFFTRGIQPHVYAIIESNDLDSHCIEYFTDGRVELKHEMDVLKREMRDAKEYGSILNVTKVKFDMLYARFDEIRGEQTPSIYSYEAIDRLLPFIQVAETLSKRYHVVVTNPPYLNNSRFSTCLDQYIKANYLDVKADLSMVMYKRAIDTMVKKNGLVSFITTSSWLNLSSFEKLRKYMQENVSLLSLVDFGTELFDGKVGHNPIVSWVICNCKMNSTITGIRLVDYCYSRRDEKETQFFQEENRYFAKQKEFDSISGAPIAYWIGDAIFHLFKTNSPIEAVAQTFRGLQPGDTKYVKEWFEVDATRIAFENTSDKVWFPMSSGGEARKWYGNLYRVVKWSNNGEEIKKSGKAIIPNEDLYFKTVIGWSRITSGQLSFRIYESGLIPGDATGCIYTERTKINILLGALNSKVITTIWPVLNSSMTNSTGIVSKIPVPQIEKIEDDIIDEIQKLVEKNIELMRVDWDSFETSWNFKEHPFLTCSHRETRLGNSENIKDVFRTWKDSTEKCFIELKQNEERLNTIFIKIYGLTDEITPEIEDKDVSLHKASLEREVRSFISYAVGCMFGRYSLDCPGLIYAGGSWNNSVYKSFQADRDAIIPICDDEYFEDDIVGRFVNFIEAVYGKGSLEENLRFIADALGGKGSSREVIRNYFINGFYADHLKAYQKRPIYWLFDSGKKNGFKCLIYMHRYQPDTIARIRTDYVHEQQSRYRTAIADLEQRIHGASTSERVKLSKQLAKLQAQAEEIRVYEEKIHHLADQMIKIDLDNGVKHNYQLFKDVLAKLK